MIPKPSRFDRQMGQYEKRMGRARAQRLSKREQAAAWDLVRKAVYDRDGGVCRACGLHAEWKARIPSQLGHAHHIIYRSAGGSSEMHNLAWLCGFCHDQEHSHRIRITGTGERITIERIDLRTSEVVKTWEG